LWSGGRGQVGVMRRVICNGIRGGGWRMGRSASNGAEFLEHCILIFVSDLYSVFQYNYMNLLESDCGGCGGICTVEISVGYNVEQSESL